MISSFHPVGANSTDGQLRQEQVVHGNLEYVLQNSVYCVNSGMQQNQRRARKTE